MLAACSLWQRSYGTAPLRGAKAARGLEGQAFTAHRSPQTRKRCRMARPAALGVLGGDPPTSSLLATCYVWLHTSGASAKAAVGIKGKRSPSTTSPQTRRRCHMARHVARGVLGGDLTPQKRHQRGLVQSAFVQKDQETEDDVAERNVKRGSSVTQNPVRRRN